MRYRKSIFAIVVAVVCATSGVAVSADTGPVTFTTFFPTESASDCTTSAVTVAYLGAPVDVTDVVYRAPTKRCLVAGRAASVDLASPQTGFALTAAGVPRPRAAFVIDYGTSPLQQNKSALVFLSFAATTVEECSEFAIDVTFEGHSLHVARALLSENRQLCRVTVFASTRAVQAPPIAFTVKLNGVVRPVIRKVPDAS